RQGRHVPTVYLLHGQNAVDIDERQQALVSELDATGVGSTVLDLASSSLDQIANACHAAPFFGAGRTIVLKNVALASKRGPRGANVPDWKDLLAVLEASPPTSTIILRADETIPSNSGIIKAAQKH